MATVFRMVASCDRLGRTELFSVRETKPPVSVSRSTAQLKLRCQFRVA